MFLFHNLKKCVFLNNEKKAFSKRTYNVTNYTKLSFNVQLTLKITTYSINFTSPSTKEKFTARKQRRGGYFSTCWSLCERRSWVIKSCCSLHSCALLPNSRQHLRSVNKRHISRLELNVEIFHNSHAKKVLHRFMIVTNQIFSNSWFIITRSVTVFYDSLNFVILLW